MPIFNDIVYRSQPQQVQKNKTDIADNLFNQNVTNEEMDEKNDDQDEQIDQNENDIHLLEDAVAAGGVLVTRKIGISTDLMIPTVETKLVFDVEVEVSNEPTAMTKDANNDTILITDGKYKIEFPVSISNALGGSNTATLRSYIKDNVTLGETFLGERVIDVTSGETVNTSLTVDYTKAGNNVTIIIKILCTANLELLDSSQMSVISYFTVAGTGVVTKSGNIGPESVVLEGVTEDELSIKEIFENYKALMIEYSVADGTIFKHFGSAAFKIRTDLDIQVLTRKIKGVVDPVDIQDVVTKGFMEAAIRTSGSNTVVKASGTDVFTFGVAFNDNGTKKLINVVDPTNAQDAVTKIYVDPVDVTLQDGINSVITSGKAIGYNEHGVYNAVITLTASVTPTIGSEEVIALVSTGDAAPANSFYFMGVNITTGAAVILQMASTGRIGLAESASSGDVITLSVSTIKA